MAKYVLGLDDSVKIQTRLAWATTGLGVVDAGAASYGSSEDVARADHKHQASTGTPVAVGTANAAGTATSLARSDHVHQKYYDLSTLGSTGLTQGGTTQVPTLSVNYGSSTPTTVNAGDTGTAGVANTASRSDHEHPVATTTASTVTGTNAEGTSTSLARADHNHALGADVVNDTHINWGTGTNQVSAVDLPIQDTGDYYTGTEVETALQEIGATLGTISSGLIIRQTIWSNVGGVTFDNALGILQTQAIQFPGQPGTGDTFTIDDGTNTVTLTAGTDFTIGATLSDTIINISAAINSEGTFVSDYSLVDDVDGINYLLFIGTAAFEAKAYTWAEKSGGGNWTNGQPKYSNDAMDTISDFLALANTDPDTMQFHPGVAQATLMTGWTYPIRGGFSWGAWYTYNQTLDTWSEVIPHRYAAVQAGDGLALNTITDPDTIYVDLATDPGLEFATGDLRVKLDSTSLQRTSSGLAINLGNANSWTALQTLGGGATIPASYNLTVAGNVLLASATRVGLPTSAPGSPVAADFWYSGGELQFRNATVTATVLDDKSSILDDVGDVTVTTGAAYDILYRNAGNTAWVNLPKGSNNTYLGINGSGQLVYSSVGGTVPSGTTNHEILIWDSGGGGWVVSGTKFTVDDATGAFSASNANFLVNSVGAVTAGSWTATIIVSTYGGTGVNHSATATGSLLVADASSPRTFVALSQGLSGQFLKSQGTGVAPAFDYVDGATSNDENAGASVTAGRLLYFDGTNNGYQHASATAVATSLVCGVAIESKTVGNPVAVQFNGRCTLTLPSTHSLVTRGDRLFLQQAAGGYVVPAADISWSTPGYLQVVVAIALQSVGANTGGAITAVLAPAGVTGFVL